MIEGFDNGTHNKPLQLAGWCNVAEEGTRAWWGYTFPESDISAGEKVAKVTPYDSKVEYGEETPCKMMLITPALDFKNADSKLFTFSVRGDYLSDNQTDMLQLYYLDNEGGEVYSSPVAGFTMPSTADESLSLSFEVKNTGQMAGDEIAQIYLSPTSDGQQIRPIQLQGFARVSLQPGETKTVKVKLYTEQFGFYSHQDQRQWNIAPGSYIIKVGASSTDIKLQEKVTLKGETVTKPLRDYYFSETSIQ